MEESKPRSLRAGLVLLPLTVVATAVFVPLVLTDLWFLLWAALGIYLLGLIYKTWRG